MGLSRLGWTNENPFKARTESIVTAFAGVSVDNAMADLKRARIFSSGLSRPGRPA